MTNSRRFDPKALINQWNDQLGDIYKEAEETLFPILINLREIENRYDLASKIGSGGEKIIDRVYDKQTGRFVAMARPIKKDPEDYEHFLNEARLLTSLQHPNIIPVYDIGLIDDEPFFTMEYLQSGNLKELLNNPKKINLEIFLQVCDAIAYAHSNGILNLDIKPENIHIGSFSKVYVLDWGLACAFREKNLGKTNQLQGTPGFIAPEQLNPTLKPGRHTDIYQLGALLYCIIYRKPPIEGKSIEQIFLRTLDGHVSSVDKSQNQKRLNNIISKAMARNPKDRYKSVLELRKDVQLYNDGYPTSVENDSFSIQLGLLYKRHKTLCQLSLFFIFLIASSTIIFISEIATKEKIEESNRLKSKKLLISHDNLKKSQLEIETLISHSVKNVISSIPDPFTRNEIFSSTIRGLIEAHRYNSAKNYAAEVLKYQSFDDDIWLMLGSLNFIQLNLDQAKQNFEKSNQLPSSSLLLEILNKHSYENGILYQHILTDILTESSSSQNWNWIRYHILMHHSLTKTTTSHLNLIKGVLEKLNPNSNIKLNYSVNDNGSVLSLNGSKGLKTILLGKPNLTAFDSLKLQEIHLDGVSFFEGLDELENKGVFIIY